MADKKDFEKTTTCVLWTKMDGNNNPPKKVFELLIGEKYLHTECNKAAFLFYTFKFSKTFAL